MDESVFVESMGDRLTLELPKIVCLGKDESVADHVLEYAQIGTCLIKVFVLCNHAVLDNIRVCCHNVHSGTIVSHEGWDLGRLIAISSP